jgi:hypothetical protein
MTSLTPDELRRLAEAAGWQYVRSGVWENIHGQMCWEDAGELDSLRDLNAAVLERMKWEQQAKVVVLVYEAVEGRKFQPDAPKSVGITCLTAPPETVTRAILEVVE